MFEYIKERKNIFIIALVLVFLVGALYLGWQFIKPADASGIILFYSNSCSHCANVEKYIKANDVESKIEFSQLEVSDNQKNVELLAQKALYCKVDLGGGAPIPFLWDGEKCLVGDVDIINFFKNEANIK